MRSAWPKAPSSRDRRHGRRAADLSDHQRRLPSPVGDGSSRRGRGHADRHADAGRQPDRSLGPLFAQDSVAVSDASCYPAFDEVRATFLDLRRDNLKRLDAMTEADLDRATPWQPQGLEEHFATVGKALLTVALHQTMHRGQVTDAMQGGRAGKWGGRRPPRHRGRTVGAVADLPRCRRSDCELTARVRST